MSKHEIPSPKISQIQNKKFKDYYWKLVKIILILVFLVFFSYFLSILLFDILFPNILGSYGYLSKFLVTFVLILLFIEISGAFLMIFITFIVYKRTNYVNFLLEGINYLLMTVIILFLIYEYFHMNTTVVLYVFILEFILIIHYSSLKKPLIWDTPYHRKILNFNNIEKSDIIFRQSLFINQFEDGYSSRPIFKDFSGLYSSNINLDTIERKSLLFAKFLSRNGDLIGYQQKNTKLYLYLRSSLMKRTDIYNPIGFFKKFIQIVYLRNLSTITFDFDSKEISFKLAESDYNRLDNLTYYSFVDLVLTKFKNSFEKFLTNNYIESYREIMPSNANSKHLLVDNPIVAFIIIGYVIGSLIIGSTYVYFATILDNRGIVNPIIYVIVWPFVSFIGLEILYGILTGNSGAYYYLPYVPIIVLVHFIAFILTLITFRFLLKYEKKKVTNPLYGIKIPVEVLLKT